MLSYFPSQSLSNSRPSKQAGSNIGVFWLLTASYGHYGQHVARIGLDCTCQIQLPVSDSVLFFQRWPGSYCLKPAHIQSGRPGLGFGQMHLVWKQATVQKSSGLVLVEDNRPATSFPLSDLVLFFHRQPG